MAMPSRLLALGLLLSAFQLVACAGETASSEGTIDSETNATGSAPSQELVSANVNGDAPSSPRTGAATSFASARSDIPVGGEPAPAAGDDGDNGGGSSSGGSPADPTSGAGPKPPTCSVSKDGQGFFTRTSSKSSYVAYVPASYDGSAPMRLIVGLHGCGDSAANFATWGVNPASTRGAQQHIGISIGGKDGQCWSMGADDDKILAAVDDISKCFWVHQKKVVVAGFSSGGQLAYRVGLKNASRFAGILVGNSSLYAADSNPDLLLVNSSWKVNMAHRLHTGDTVFPIAKVKADWTKTKAAGFPLLTSEVGGGHDGNSDDWNWLIPQSASWVSP